VEGEPSGDLPGFTGDIPASAAGTAATTSMWPTTAAETRSSFRAALPGVDTRHRLRLGIPSRHRLQKSFRKGWAILCVDDTVKWQITETKTLKSIQWEKEVFYKSVSNLV
jgi:hypothetical protein